MRAPDAILRTCSGTHALEVQVASSFLSRFAGLMLRAPLAPDCGLLLTQCPSVHTMFLRCPIDVVYLDKSGTVTKCVSNLKPWRGSFSHTGRDAQGKRHQRAAHTLELAAGSIARLKIRPGDRLQHPLWPQAGEEQNEATDAARPTPQRVLRPAGSAAASPRQHGSAMIEFILVGPVITLLGLAILQYGLLFFAKNQINHASFMAARAGSMGNASLANARQAYERALIPLYGGGRDAAELSAALSKAQADVGQNVRIELLNPTRESFDDWHDPALQDIIGGGRRVIPNAHQAAKDPADIRANSGQNIQDANLIKLRITHGYEPKVPLVNTIYGKYLQWLDTKGDAFHTRMVDAGRIPVVTHVTLHMQSDAIEDNPVSMPGMGNDGNPTDPGDPPMTGDPPPNCLTIGCTVENKPVTPTDPGGGGENGGGECTGSACPPCEDAANP